jgi:hypothetical protein
MKENQPSNPDFPNQFRERKSDNPHPPGQNVFSQEKKPRKNSGKVNRYKTPEKIETIQHAPLLRLAETVTIGEDTYVLASIADNSAPMLLDRDDVWNLMTELAPIRGKQDQKAAHQDILFPRFIDQHSKLSHWDTVIAEQGVLTAMIADDKEYVSKKRKERFDSDQRHRDNRISSAKNYLQNMQNFPEAFADSLPMLFKYFSYVFKKEEELSNENDEIPEDISTGIRAFGKSFLSFLCTSDDDVLNRYIQEGLIPQIFSGEIRRDLKNKPLSDPRQAVQHLDRPSKSILSDSFYRLASTTSQQDYYSLIRGYIRSLGKTPAQQIEEIAKLCIAYEPKKWKVTLREKIRSDTSTQIYPTYDSLSDYFPLCNPRYQFDKVNPFKSEDNKLVIFTDNEPTVKIRLDESDDPSIIGHVLSTEELIPDPVRYPRLEEPLYILPLVLIKRSKNGDIALSFESDKLKQAGGGYHEKLFQTYGTGMYSEFTKWGTYSIAPSLVFGMMALMSQRPEIYKKWPKTHGFTQGKVQKMTQAQACLLSMMHDKSLSMKLQKEFVELF